MKKAWELINDYLYLDFNFKKKIISEINDRINHRENCRFKNLDLIAFLTRHRKFAINLISFWYPLDEIQLENYSNQLNWWYLSYNPNVLWNEFLFDKYVAKIDWLSFCDNIGFPWSLKFIEKYEMQLIDQWFGEPGEGSRLSSNEAIPWCEDLIEEYKEKWNWRSISENKRIPWSVDLIKKYKGYIDFGYLEYNKGVTTNKDIVEEFGLMVKSRLDDRECSG